MRSLFSFIFCVLLISPVVAQDWDDNGEIEDVEVEIVKEREIILPKADRNFEKIPPVTVTRTKEPVAYQFANLPFDPPAIRTRIRPLRIKPGELSKIYGNYVKAGYGNFGTPYLEGFFNAKRNEQYSYGAHILYTSSRTGPVDEENSGSGDFGLNLFGRSFTEKAVFSGDLSFRNQRNKFYGYPEGAEVDADTIEQRYNRFGLNLSMENANQDAMVPYRLAFGFSNVNDKFDASENEARIELGLRHSFGESSRIGIESDFNFISREDSLVERKTRTLIRFSPYYQFTYGDFKIKAGFRAAYENDTLKDGEQFHFYPFVSASYPILPALELFAGLDGNIEKVTLNSLSAENPFVDANIPIFHSNKTFEFFGGIRGKLSSTANYEAGFSIATYENLYFYINDPGNPSRFVPVYDQGNTEVINLYGSLGLTDSDVFNLSFRGDVFAYTPANVDKAWHRENYKLSILGRYKLFEKILLGADLYALGGINALNPEDLSDVTLDAAFDLNLNAEYLVSPRGSVFLQLNNVFGNEYELLNRYPVRGFQFLVGLTYSF